MAADEAQASPPLLPALALVRPDLAVAKALMYLCPASVWVACAGAATGAVTLACAAVGEASPVVDALIAASCRALLSAALLVLVAVLLVLRAAVLNAGFRAELRVRKASEASNGSMLQDTAFRGWLATLPFGLLMVVGCLLLVSLSPTKESQMGRICALMVEVGVVGAAALVGFVVIPTMAMRLWRMKLGGGTAASSIV